MRIVLVSMPWAAIHTPSLALGILTSRVNDRAPDVHVDVVYGNLACAEWMAQTVPEASIEDYNFFALSSYFMGCGDWVFSSALYEDPRWHVDAFERRVGDRLSYREREFCLRLHEDAPRFIEAMVCRISALRPDLVCFTSTFQQNVASLAVARHLQARNPEVRTVMGGANCDGVQGEAIHRAFDFVDFVLRGEGEEAFPDLLRRLMASDDLSDLPGLCWRDGGATVVNPMTQHLLPPSEIAAPNHDAYFDQLRQSNVAEWIEPWLVVESARGCWWGEKHHCTFCGLNGSAMPFRSKQPDSFSRELEKLARRHRILDVFVVDNIIDMQYLNTVIRDLAEGQYDYRIHYEIKSNLNYQQLELLRDAGVVSLQPGIESLSNDVLRIMDKGSTGTINVRLLRDAESLGLTTQWNYLYGFPGETDEQYLAVIEQIPALHHLQPPEGATRIALERFSPYFDRPELGYANRRPHWQYEMIYDLPAHLVYDLAYLFDTTDKGIKDEVEDQLHEAVSHWSLNHYPSILYYIDQWENIELTNTRPGYDWETLELRDPSELVLFRELDQPRSFAKLCSAAAAAGAGTASVEDAVRMTLRRWRDLGLVFTDGVRYIHVATTVENQRLCRVRGSASGWWQNPTARMQEVAA